MKKITIFFALLLFSSVIFFSCSNNYFLFAKENLSESREVVFEGKSDKFFVTFMMGKREKDYSFDGISTELVDFGVLTVHVLDTKLLHATATSFTLVLNEKNYSGEFEMNPYDKSFVSDIGVFEQVDGELKVNIVVGSVEQDFVLTNVSQSWNVSSERALEIATEELKRELKEFIENNKFLAEVYVKVLYDYKNFTGYYWHISFFGENGSSIACVIENINGEVLAKNSYKK